MGSDDMGTSIGRYVVLEEAGRGAMGRVLRAYDPKLQREVALKEVRRSAVAVRLVTEARAMAKLAHPNVVAVFDVEELEHDRVVLAMEYVRGQTLTAWLTEPRAWSEIVARFREAGAGLAAAHAAGLLHRDFKPDNVLVATNVVKVTDFGLAKVDAPIDLSTTDASSPMSTAAGVVLGTPRYMAPEQHRAESLTPAADQYAFCVALWEALCGAAPFDREDIALAKANGPPAWPGGATPRPIVDAIARGLAPDPEERWPSMHALLDALAYDPARTRRRWLVAGATIGLLGVAALAMRSWALDRAERCSGTAAAAHLQGVWDDARRTEVRDAVLAVDVSYATDAWTHAEPVLDAYATAWQDMHVEACAATAIHGDQSPAVLDLRMACLKRANVVLAAVTDTLAHADTQTVQRSHELTASLVPLTRCADVVALQHDVEPPLPEEAAIVDELRVELAACRAAQTSGHYDEARRRLDAAMARAHEFDYPPLHADLLIEEGFGLAREGKYAEADVKLREAVQRTAELKQWGAMQDAAVVLLTTVGSSLRWFDQVTPYVDLARGLAGDDPIREARVCNNYGLSLLMQSRYAEAETEFRRALEIREELLDPDNPELATTRMNLANVLDAQDRHAEAVAEHRRALALLERIAPEHPRVAGARTNLAITLQQQGHYAEAEAELRKAIALREKVLGKDHPDLGLSLVALGHVLRAQGRFDEAEAVYRRTLAIDEKALGPEHPRTANARDNIAVALRQRGELAEAEAEHRRALAIRERALGPDHPDTASSRNNLAGLLQQMHRADEAVAEYRLALAVLEKTFGPDHLRSAAVRQNLALALADVGAFEEAKRHAEAGWRAHERDDVALDKAGVAAFQLAVVLWKVDEAERGRAVDVAELGLVMLAAYATQEEAVELRAWLDTHARP